MYCIINLVMRILLSLVVMTCGVAGVRGDETPASVAARVGDKDVSALVAALSSAIDSPDPLARATAARIVAIRNLSQLIPKVRDRLAVENDTSAAREEVRALVIGGERTDVDRAIAMTRSMSRGIDTVIMRAIARRADAIDLLPTLREIHVPRTRRL